MFSMASASIATSPMSMPKHGTVVSASSNRHSFLHLVTEHTECQKEKKYFKNQTVIFFYTFFPFKLTLYINLDNSFFHTKFNLFSYFSQIQSSICILHSYNSLIMDPNMTPTSSRNRSTRAGSSQDEQQPYQPYNPHLPFGGTNVSFELTPGGMIASGQRPTYFGNPP